MIYTEQSIRPGDKVVMTTGPIEVRAVYYASSDPGNRTRHVYLVDGQCLTVHIGTTLKLIPRDAER